MDADIIAIQSQNAQLTAQLRTVEQQLFAERAEAKQQLARAEDRLAALTSQSSAILSLQKEVKAAVAKLASVEEAITSELTCLSCLNVFEDPVPVHACRLARLLICWWPDYSHSLWAYVLPQMY